MASNKQVLSAKKFVWLIIAFTLVVLLFLIDFNTNPFRVDVFNIKMSEITGGINHQNSKIVPFSKSNHINQLVNTWESSHDKDFHLSEFIEKYLSEPVSNLATACIDKLILYRLHKKYINIVKDESPNSSFAVIPVHSIFKLDKNIGNLPEPVLALQLYSAKSEWESFQVVIAPFNKKLKNIQVKIEGSPFGTNNMECWQGAYVNCLKAYYKTKPGWYADPLIAMTIDSSHASEVLYTSTFVPFDVPEQEARSVWINYFVPPDFKAGNYSFKVTIMALNTENNTTESQSTEIKLRVFDFALPRTMHLKTAFSFHPENIATSNFYKDYQLNEAKRKESYQFMLNYRLNPSNIYTSMPSPGVEDWPWCIEHGANAFNLGYLDYNKHDSILFFERFKIKLKADVTYLNQHNLLKYAYYYGFDEVTPRDYYKLKLVKEYMKNANSSIPFACTVIPNQDLIGSVNIWVPLTKNFNEAACKERQQAGDEAWWYVCNFPNTKGYPNFFIEYPAIDPRILFWQTSKYNLDGFLYYATTNWQNNSYNEQTNKSGGPSIYDDNPNKEALKKGLRWPEIPWVSFSYMRFNGDGQLLYPGKNQKIWPSVRLINIRDGIEDYEYFYQLRKLRSILFAKGLTNEVLQIDLLLNKAYSMVPATNDYENNPQKLLEIRKEAGLLLEQLVNKHDFKITN